MKDVNNKIVKELLLKPLWQMTGQEFCALTHYAQDSYMGHPLAPSKVRITGVRALAEYLDCCESTVFMLRRNGVLDDAILSRVGKKIVFDGDKARELAMEFQYEQRAAQKSANKNRK